MIMETIHKGFSISLERIQENRKTYVGLVARKRGIKIESPINNGMSIKGIYKAINELNSKS